MIGDGTKENTTPQRVPCLDSCHTRLASAEQHRPRREAVGVGHQNDELLRHEPAHFAHRQPEAVPEKPEEQGIDLLQVVSEPQLSWTNACLTMSEVRLDRRRQRDDLLIFRHCDERRMVAPADPLRPLSGS